MGKLTQVSPNIEAQGLIGAMSGVSQYPFRVTELQSLRGFRAAMTAN